MPRKSPPLRYDWNDLCWNWAAAFLLKQLRNGSQSGATKGVIGKNVKRPCNAGVLNIREGRTAWWQRFVKIVQRGAFRGQFMPYYGKVKC